MLGRIDWEEIRERLASLTETVDFIETSEANPLTKYLEIDSARTFGRETWKLLLGVVLGLVLLELILQRIFGRGEGEFIRHHLSFAGDLDIIWVAGIAIGLSILSWWLYRLETKRGKPSPGQAIAYSTRSRWLHTS